MNYQIEVRPEHDLIIARHIRYESANDLMAMLSEVKQHFDDHPYRRLLADYSRLEAYNLGFIDKIHVLGRFAPMLIHIAHHIRMAAVTRNEFQKGVAQQARALASAEGGDNITGTTHYFEDEESALAWLLDGD
jgi:hypothetical protein